MKIYISGPITGTEGYLQRFAVAENELIASGHKVINPARVNAQLPESTTHEEYMKMSLCMMDMCDTVFMLKGWRDSKGANMEFEYARGTGMTIIFEGGKGCGENPNRQEPTSSHRKLGKKS